MSKYTSFLRSGRVWLVAVLICLVGALHFYERLILLTQNQTHYAKSMEIHGITINRPDDWLLESSKSSSDSNLKHFGFFPSFEESKNSKSLESESFVIFRQIDSDDSRVYFDKLTESSRKEFSKKIQGRMSNSEDGFSTIAIFNHKAILVKAFNDNSGTLVYFPHQGILVNSSELGTIRLFESPPVTP